MSYTVNNKLVDINLDCESELGYFGNANSFTCEPGRFQNNKLNVVIWKNRITPGKRKIPKNLKLAILARGRIKLPIEKIKWILDQNQQLDWIKQLPQNFEEQFPKADVTIELFLRRTILTVNEVSRIFQGYLEHRHYQELTGCKYFAGYWYWAEGKEIFEQNLGISIKKLFDKANVKLPQYMQQKDKERFYLLIYVSFSKTIEKFFVKPKPIQPDIIIPPPPSIKDKFQPLIGLTSESYYNLRQEPSEKSYILGKMLGKSIPVKITDKALNNDGKTWYYITLQEQMPIKKDGKLLELPKGKKCWVIEDALIVRVANWNYFRNQLINFEAANRTLSLDERITKLRQMSHSRNLPFDDVIGTPKGDEYLDTRRFNKVGWQISKDYQAVQTPDGRWVDIFHLLVGLDVLRKPEKDTSYAGIDIGTNYSAATWAGDIGAAAADATLKSSKTWEERNSAATSTRRIEFYYNTRSPEWDLLGDIDAWGINSLRKSHKTIHLDTIDKLLTFYYKELRRVNLELLTVQRKKSIKLFLRHYNFKYDVRKNYKDYPALIKQEKPYLRIYHEIRKFGRIWIFKKKPFSKIKFPNRTYTSKMARLFLIWLEREAIKNG
ncbi:MAG: hypothetical protein F6K18_04610 [Okeania sp. SIO2C2]|uniref:hypothetical protein n=1 Tax=Okeania sp. SIO2C2 TaxID=2607787 RepID=UPI0013BCC85A|nr:hypothetical protein [Okeania sp. SIO2C2]NEP86156.1 hypothetical protein [Okeania sp. SIO2C2]